MNMLVLTIIFPLIGFILLAFSTGRWSENLSGSIGIGSIGLAALVTAYISIDFYNKGQHLFSTPLWRWISVSDFKIHFNLMLDGLSLIMLSMVTGVGLLIHIFSSWYIRGEEGHSRFFAYTNLFIASMLVLILADNLLMMYLGWECVGLCSYLLIGFYYTNLKNSASAMKAFLITRIGDVCLILGIFILYNELGTLNFYKIIELTQSNFETNNHMLYWATLMLLGGAISKSAQLPLQTWLADAMVGPTPVSALIHAATMVTAGVYLIARTYSLFLMNPEILYLVGVIGSVTLILASFSALVQTNIKRILAYSTMSQIGYMFLALGVQAWNAAIFHLITHAFFKALLFLSSGSIILACNKEQNIFKMGGLRKSIPAIYFYFLVGGASLAGFPLITAGFFSKGEILAGAMVHGDINLMLVGLFGTFMTSMYIFRMIFIIFHGNKKIHVHLEHRLTYHLPLIVLLIFSTFVGALILRPIGSVLPGTARLEHNGALILEVTSGVATVAGILIAAWLWLGKYKVVPTIANNRFGRLLRMWWYNAWGFDLIYNLIFVKPFIGFASILKSDPLNMLMNIPVILVHFISKSLLLSENGYLRWYIASIGVGVTIILALLLTLR